MAPDDWSPDGEAVWHHPLSGGLSRNYSFALIPKKKPHASAGKEAHAQLVNREIANSDELDVAVIRTQRLCADVFQLFQRPQRGFHEAVLFLIAFDQTDQITGITQSPAQ